MDDNNETVPERASEVLEFWFAARQSDGPGLDGRMKQWFGSDAAFDEAVREGFGDDIRRALAGEHRDWMHTPRGRLALILLLDQFPRNVWRGTREAFDGDAKALQLTLDGIRKHMDRRLQPLERAFFYMPLQHAENAKVQTLSTRAFTALAAAVAGTTLHETFQTMAEFADLHRDIVEQFGRFPHRNELLGREHTEEERRYLGDDTPTFGQ